MTEPRFVVLMPVLNDWANAASVLAEVDSTFSARGWAGSALIVDDGSSENAAPLDFSPASLQTVEVIRLRRNLGHQRAISVGLCHLERSKTGAHVIVMDGDGQDAPADIPALVEEFERHAGRRVVFAGRTKRPEGSLFKAFYWLYRVLHRLLTGRTIRVGNFSVLPGRAVGAITCSPDAWSHYAAAVYQTRLPVAVVDIARAKRLKGPPKMKFVGLVTHGLAAIAVFGDIVSVRLLIAAAAASLAAGVLVVAAWVAVATEAVEWAAGGVWAAAAALILLTQLNVGALVVGFLIHRGRRAAPVIPRRDFEHFIDRVEHWSGRGITPRSGASASA
ncbi:MAG: glycosyltransferase [Gemmatimonadota bacterium]